MNFPRKDPSFWRERAEETRTKAESYLISESDKQRLLNIAVEYEQIAERAEQWRTVAELK